VTHTVKVEAGAQEPVKVSLEQTERAALTRTGTSRKRD
jgi:hypothetical protein